MELNTSLLTKASFNAFQASSWAYSSAEYICNWSKNWLNDYFLNYLSGG